MGLTENHLLNDEGSAWEPIGGWSDKPNLSPYPQPACCEINTQGLGWCKCENCHWYISKTEAAKAVRNYMIDKLWGGESNL